MITGMGVYSMKKYVKDVIALLDQHYGTEYKCYLNHENAWQLLVATILSAQCTDERVNMVTEKLFKKYDSIEKLAGANQSDLENDIHSTGFFRNKAANIIMCCKKIMSDFGGEVPRTLEELTSLSGVGRKTANVVRGNIFNDPSIVVDTHVKRVSLKLGFTKETNPEKIEYDLMKLLPKDHWILYNIQIIAHGRSICVARKPKCEECFLNKLCPSRIY